MFINHFSTFALISRKTGRRVNFSLNNCVEFPLHVSASKMEGLCLLFLKWTHTERDHRRGGVYEISPRGSKSWAHEMGDLPDFTKIIHTLQVCLLENGPHHTSAVSVPAWLEHLEFFFSLCTRLPPPPAIGCLPNCYWPEFSLAAGESPPFADMLNVFWRSKMHTCVQVAVWFHCLEEAARPAWFSGM